MKFLYPQLLFALSALAIPILIHLFQLRKTKTVYFSNLKFLKQVNQQTKKMSRLQHILVLLSRLLAFAFIILAFAQPYLPVDKAAVQAEKRVSIYLDNSLSMQSENAEGLVFDQAQAKAIAIVEAFDPDIKFHVLSNNLDGAYQRLVSKAEAIDYLEQIEPENFSLNLEQVLASQLAVLGNAPGNQLYWVSDFQTTFLPTQLSSLPDSIYPLCYAVPIFNEQQANVYIDSVAFAAPLIQSGEISSLEVFIKNASKQQVDLVPVRLLINNKQVAIASSDIEAEEQKSIPLAFQVDSSGWFNAEVQIDDYPMSFDNSWYLSFYVPDEYKVLSLYDKELSNFSKLFGIDQRIKHEAFAVNQAPLDKFSSYDLIILYGDQLNSGLTAALQSYMESGGKLLFFPPAPSAIDANKSALAQLGLSNVQESKSDFQVNKIAYEHALFSNVFEEESDIFQPIQAKLLYSFAGMGGVPLLSSQSGKAFISWHAVGSGNLILAHSPLASEYHNFLRHGLFVPIVYNAAIYQSAQQKAWLSINEEEKTWIYKSDATSEKPIVLKKGDFSIIPDQIAEGNKTGIFLSRNIPEAGFYQAYQNDVNLADIAVNLDRSESMLNYVEMSGFHDYLSSQGIALESVIDSELGSIQAKISSEQQDKELWFMCLVLALIFLLLESILLKYFKA